MPVHQLRGSTRVTSSGDAVGTESGLKAGPEQEASTASDDAINKSFFIS